MSLIILKATDLLFERIRIFQVGASPSYTHLLGGPSTRETFIPASGFQIRKSVEADFKSFDFHPRAIRFPRQTAILVTWEMVRETSVGCVGNLTEGIKKLLLK